MNEAAVAGLTRRVPVATARSSAPRRALSAELLHGAAAFKTLADDWRRLTATNRKAAFFQTHEFLAAWAEHFRRGEKLVTVVVRRDGAPVLIWPLTEERRALLRVVRGAGSPVSQYDDILIDPEVDPEAAMAAALDALTRALRPDLVLLERVREDGALRDALRNATPLCAGEAAPYADLSQGAAAVLAAQKPIVVKKQRKRVRRFQKEGDVVFAVATGYSQARDWLTEALTLKREWLRSTGKVSRAFVCSATEACLTDLAQRLRTADPSTRMLVSKLMLDGRPAAFEAGFLHRDTYYIYLRAFAPELAVFGPGNILTEHTLEWCAANGITRYDMMAPRSRNKREWQTGEVAVFDYALATTMSGQLYAELVLKRLVPFIRDAFYALPDRVRSAIAEVTLKL